MDGSKPSGERRKIIGGRATTRSPARAANNCAAKPTNLTGSSTQSTKFCKPHEEGMSKLLRRLVYWIRRRRMGEELAEEIEFHRVLKQQSLEQSGLPSEHATSASRRALGNVFNAREDARGVWIYAWLDQLERD